MKKKVLNFFNLVTCGFIQNIHSPPPTADKTCTRWIFSFKFDGLHAKNVNIVISSSNGRTELRVFSLQIQRSEQYSTFFDSIFNLFVRRNTRIIFRLSVQNLHCRCFIGCFFFLFRIKVWFYNVVYNILYYYVAC